MPNLIEVGRTQSPYGVRGWIRVAPEEDGAVPSSTRAWWYQPLAGGDPVRLEVEGVKPHGEGLIAKWKGCESPEAAKGWKGRILVDRADFPDLPEGEWWACDLVGCRVLTPAGEELGVVRSLLSNGAQDILEVNPGSGKSLLIPVVPAYVLGVDAASKLITADWQRDWS